MTMRYFTPVTPEPDTAQQWAEDELNKGIYQGGESLLDIIGRWISDFLSTLLTGADGAGFPPLGYLIGALIVLALLIAAARIAAPLLKDRARARRHVLDGDDLRSAAQMRAAATAAFDAGDYQGATLDAFRAIVRGAEERVVIDERAGRTAREAVRDIVAALPGATHELRAAAKVFDEVCYGHRDASKDDATTMIALERSVAERKIAVVAP